MLLQESFAAHGRHETVALPAAKSSQDVIITDYALK